MLSHMSGAGMVLHKISHKALDSLLLVFPSLDINDHVLAMFIMPSSIIEKYLRHDFLLLFLLLLYKFDSAKWSLNLEF